MCIITEIPTIIDPSAIKNYPSATGSIIVGISVTVYIYAPARQQHPLGPAGAYIYIYIIYA
jgi:hypothetical protein